MFNWVKILLLVIAFLTIVSPQQASAQQGLSDQIARAIKNYPGCRVYQGINCVQCSESFYFDENGICTLADPQCRVFNTDMRMCQGCYDGYEQVDGKCVAVDLLSEQYRGCRNFTEDVCVDCSFRFYFDEEQICRQVSDDCRTWDEENGSCLSCYGGYILEQGICRINPIFLGLQNNLCAKFQNSTCVQCAFRAFFNSQGICEQVDPFCKTYDNFDGKCLSCFNGYQLIDDTCVIIDEMNMELIQSNDQSTGQSAGQFILAQGTGQETNLGPVLALGQADGNIGIQSTVIDDGPFQQKTTNIGIPQMFNQGLDSRTAQQTAEIINQNVFQVASQMPPSQISMGVQDQSMQFTDFSQLNLNPNCRRFQDDVCVECSFRFYFNEDGICEQVSDFCMTWDQQNGDCLTCYGGYKLVEANCVLIELSQLDPGCHIYNMTDNTCLQCSQRYVRIGDNCTQVSDFCQQWDDLAECTSCYIGYILKDGQCVLGNPLCRQQKQTGGCLSCYNGYVLQDMECVSLQEIFKRQQEGQTQVN